MNASFLTTPEVSRRLFNAVEAGLYTRLEILKQGLTVLKKRGLGVKLFSELAAWLKNNSTEHQLRVWRKLIVNQLKDPHFLPHCYRNTKKSEIIKICDL